MAMVDQKSQVRQGNANLIMYPLAVTPPASSCNSSGSPSSTCFFYDVTAGTNSMPCVKNSPNCTVTNPSDANGVLSGYPAGVGYDEATGLGSVNAFNFVNAANWTGGVAPTPSFTLTPSPSTVTITSPGAQGTLILTFTSINGYTGTINLSPTACSFASGEEAACSFSVPSVSISPTTTTATATLTITTTAATAVVPAGRYNAPKLWPAATAFTLSCFLAMTFLLFSPRGNRRWSTALALVAFGLMISISACGGTGGGGGGGGGGTGGTPVGTTSGTITVKDVAGTTTESITFTLTVN
jgi:hypothetical protein